MQNLFFLLKKSETFSLTLSLCGYLNGNYIRVTILNLYTYLYSNIRF